MTAILELGVCLGYLALGLLGRNCFSKSKPSRYFTEYVTEHFSTPGGADSLERVQVAVRDDRVAISWYR